MGGDQLVQADPETHPEGVGERASHALSMTVCLVEKMTFPETPWSLPVCKCLYSSDNRGNKGWTECRLLLSSGVLFMFSVPMMPGCTKLCNLIMHHVKKYVLAYCKKLRAIYSHSCLLYS